MNGLIIKSPWIDKIFSGNKFWEVRGSHTKIRGKIALIKSGSSKIYGTCELVDVAGPLSKKDLLDNMNKHCVPESLFADTLPYKKTYAWVLKNAERLEEPVPYNHPSGAVIWVKLRDASWKDME